MYPYYGYPGYAAYGQPAMGSAWGAPVAAAPPQGGSPPTSWYGAASPSPGAAAAYPYGASGYYGYSYGYGAPPPQPVHGTTGGGAMPPPLRDRSRSRSPRGRRGTEAPPLPARPKVGDNKGTKHRFCALVNSPKGCARGAECRFAHTREELDPNQLLTPDEERLIPSALTDEFWVYKFKCFWCPIGVQHKWMECPYAHNYQDARRDPRIGYGPKLCPTWKKSRQTDDYVDRCPNGVRCPFAHGAKENLYHPAMFRTGNCNDLRGNRCPRGVFCAFFHDPNTQRHPPNKEYDYNTRLPEDDVDKDWLEGFLSPAYAAGDGTYDPRGGGGGPRGGGPRGRRDRSISP